MKEQNLSIHTATMEMEDLPLWSQWFLCALGVLVVVTGVLSQFFWMRLTYNLCVGQPDGGFPGVTWKEWPWITLLTSHIVVPFFLRKKDKSKPAVEKAPSNAEFLLWLFLPREGREAAIGDTNEMFEKLVEDFGPRRATLWYWCEVAKSVGPLLMSAIKKLLGLCVLDWIRRCLSN